MVIVQLHYCKDRFLDSPLHVCVTLAIVCLQRPEENIKMNLLWEKFIFQEDIFSSLNPFVMVLLASAVFCNSFNQFDSWACWPATILDFFSTHFRSCDYESKVYCLKLFSFLPWTTWSGWSYICTCFFMLHWTQIWIQYQPLFFVALAEHTSTAGVILCPSKDHLPWALTRLNFRSYTA